MADTTVTATEVEAAIGEECTAENDTAEVVHAYAGDDPSAPPSEVAWSATLTAPDAYSPTDGQWQVGVYTYWDRRGFHDLLDDYTADSKAEVLAWLVGRVAGLSD